MSVDVGGIRDVRSLLAGSRGVLFDFDGPVCRLFPHDSSRSVADELRGLVAEAGHEHLLTAREREDKDPHVVLRAMDRALPDGDDLVAALEAHVSEREVEAAEKALPTPGAARFIRRLAERGVRLAVVTNNSARAASHYLEAEGLLGCFDAVHGRTRDLDRMKPHPDIVRRALVSLGLGREEAVMIGDSPVDVTAAHGAGVGFIGYGRNELKESRLRWAGAGVVVDSYALFLDEA